MIRSPSWPVDLAGRLLELLDEARLALLAALLEVEREVVQRERRTLLVVRVEHRAAGPRPTSRPRPRTRRRRPGHRGRMSPRARSRPCRAARRSRSARRPGPRPRARPPQTRRRSRPGCTAPRARSRSRRSRCRSSTRPCRVLEPGPDAERHVGGDREVVGVVVDQRQPAERGDAPPVPIEELGELLGRLDDEIGPLEGGVVGELTEHVVAAHVHVDRLLSRGTRGRVPAVPEGTSSGVVRRSIRRPDDPARGWPRRPPACRGSRSRAGRA